MSRNDLPFSFSNSLTSQCIFEPSGFGPLSRPVFCQVWRVPLGPVDQKYTVGEQHGCLKSSGDSHKILSGMVAGGFRTLSGPACCWMWDESRPFSPSLRGVAVELRGPCGTRAGVGCASLRWLLAMRTAKSIRRLLVHGQGPDQRHDPADTSPSQQHVDEDGTQHILLVSGQHDDGGQEV